ncbi:MAG: SprT-like domain-containing protein [Ignavibacteria bacterium]|nr:SprT-like domain-containing protein [Ignavibacteria bacterium]
MLKNYLPEESVPVALSWLEEFKFHFKITKSRTSKLGDYRPAHRENPHRITVNHNLNKYSFLITLTHEVAHLTAWNKYRNKILPHGKEWKEEFRTLLLPFFTLNIFPEDVLKCLSNYSLNPKASSCTDLHLVKVLKKYDENSVYIHLEEIPLRSIFRLRNGREFIKGDRIRKRFKFTDLHPKKAYLFSPVAEVIQTTLF